MCFLSTVRECSCCHVYDRTFPAYELCHPQRQSHNSSATFIIIHTGKNTRLILISRLLTSAREVVMVHGREFSGRGQYRSSARAL
jgi:hypothetical protein